MYNQMSLKEYVDPFTGEPSKRKQEKISPLELAGKCSA